MLKYVEFRLVYLSKYDHSLVHLASHVIRRPLVINTLYRLLLKCPPNPKTLQMPGPKPPSVRKRTLEVSIRRFPFYHR